MRVGARVRVGGGGGVTVRLGVGVGVRVGVRVRVTLNGRCGTAATPESSASTAEDGLVSKSSGSPLLMNGGGTLLSSESVDSKSPPRLEVSSTLSKEAGPLFLAGRPSMIASLNVSVAGLGPSDVVSGGETPCSAPEASVHVLGGPCCLSMERGPCCKRPSAETENLEPMPSGWRAA